MSGSGPSGSAGVLSCPDCGGPASPESTLCAYCGAALALVACPNCLGRIFKGARHCSHCGASVSDLPATAPSDLRCPRCASALRVVRVGNADLGECERCGGTWVDGRTFERIVAEKEEQSLVLQAALPGFERRKAEARSDRYWPCPVCHKLMNRVNFAHVSGVVLDACKLHGVWFDQDELRQLVEFIRSGGMDRAREQEHAQMGPPATDDRIAALLRADVGGMGETGALSGALKVLDWIVRQR